VDREIMTEHYLAWRRPAVTLILVAVALAAVSIDTGPADAAFPGGNGRIAFCFRQLRRHHQREHRRHWAAVTAVLR